MFKTTIGHRNCFKGGGVQNIKKHWASCLIPLLRDATVTVRTTRGCRVLSVQGGVSAAAQPCWEALCQF